ncbi:MAG: type II toxin-antitoxin system Phd/YefM family antitoxin [Phycisphaerales bacterium]|nr:type II toxin-antitoxin system Phd/YefM family antitoxin [Phycisphaerales bacterium]
MVFQPGDVHPLDEFLRNHKVHIERMKKAGRPEVLTVNGRAELVIQDSESYQQLLDVVERAEAVQGIRRGLADLEAARTKPVEQVIEDMGREFRIRAPNA